MQVSEILNKAADLVEEHGWVQKGGWPGVGVTPTLCLEGGLMAAMGFDDLYIASTEFYNCPAYRAVREYLGLSFGHPCDSRSSLWGWNDQPTRTQEEVIAVLRSAAMVEALKEARNGNIGEPVRHIEFEPMPETTPISEPSPEVAPEPVPA